MINHKKRLFPAMVIGTAATSLLISTIVSRSKSSAQAGGSWVPYTITYKIYASAPDKPAVLVADQIKAVRSDGASAQSSTFYHMDGERDRVERTLMLPGGIRVRTDDTLGVMTATKNATEDGALSSSHQLDPSRSCAALVGAGGQSPSLTASAGESILGYATYLLSNDLKRYKDQLWRAPSLGCATLRILGQKVDTATGAVISTSETEAVSVQAGEPDPRLFQLPSGLKNIAPSDMASLQAKVCCNKQLASTDLAPMQAADSHFHQFRFDF
jgi:hypothetical protein